MTTRTPITDDAFPYQEAAVERLRYALPLPPDDLLVVTQDFLFAAVLRSVLDRYIRCHGVGNLNALKPATP